MKIYTIVGGVNGVGKSSLSGVLMSEHTDLGRVIDTDKLTAENGGDRIKGGKLAVKLINTSLSKGISFTQETTLSGVKTLKTIEAARNLDFYIRLYYVGISSAAESLDRISNRVRKGGHDIPRNDVISRYNKRFSDLAAVLPYCDEVHLYDNENGFTEVAEYKNGSIIVKGEYVPEWLNELQRFLKEEHA